MGPTAHQWRLLADLEGGEFRCAEFCKGSLAAILTCRRTISAVERIAELPWTGISEEISSQFG